MMTELLISEVMTAVENHEPVDVGAAAQRCRSRLPDHPETDQQLKVRLQSLALEYGAGSAVGNRISVNRRCNMDRELLPGERGHFEVGGL
jgi:hypothetical protein